VRVAEVPADLIIVDYAMPGLTGVDVVMRARTTAPDMPVLLATGHADMEAVDRVMPMDRVLRKPFRLAEFGVAVRKALASSTA